MARVSKNKESCTFPKGKGTGFDVFWLEIPKTRNPVRYQRAKVQDLMVFGQKFRKQDGFGNGQPRPRKQSIWRPKSARIRLGFAFRGYQVRGFRISFLRFPVQDRPQNGQSRFRKKIIWRPKGARIRWGFGFRSCQVKCFTYVACLAWLVGRKS